VIGGAPWPPPRTAASPTRCGPAGTTTSGAAATAAAQDLRARLTAEQRLGAEIADLRHDRGLSQSALAERAAVQQADISRIERGFGNPTRDTLVRLADALGARLTLEPRADRTR
jgi:ribosome-binding protein aMBF1 (putative translation factor)